MRHRAVLTALAFVLVASALYAHDLFIKLDTFLVEPHSRVRVPLLNGTFALSDASFSVDRVADLVVAGPNGASHPRPEGWDATGDTTYFTLETGAPGTYVLGISTRSRLIELDAESFNAYLEHDGIPDVLEERRATGRLDEPATERYSKHVKAVYQVGATPSVGGSRALGFPAELVPLANPYELEPGDELTVRCLVHGRPAVNQLVIAGGEVEAQTIEEREVRSDADGVARFVLDRAGKWYVKFIHMEKTEEAGVDYESVWATLTFEILGS